MNGSAGVIQLVECQLPKLDVAGSSPVARSDKSLMQNRLEAVSIGTGGHFIYLKAFPVAPGVLRLGGHFVVRVECVARKDASGA